VEEGKVDENPRGSKHGDHTGNDSVGRLASYNVPSAFAISRCSSRMSESASSARVPVDLAPVAPAGSDLLLYHHIKSSHNALSSFRINSALIQ
jgi:hypothetical protein